MEFGELGESLQNVLVALQKDEGSAVAAGGGRSNLQSIGDIQRFMDRYPEFRKQQSTVAKHVALTSELSSVCLAVVQFLSVRLWWFSGAMVLQAVTAMQMGRDRRVEGWNCVLVSKISPQPSTLSTSQPSTLSTLIHQP
eukprot:3771844-Rhodomonas_salina.1